MRFIIYVLMTDEFTDIAVLKQLVLLGRYVTASEGVKTSYLCIVDIPDGKAVSILDIFWMENCSI